MRLEYQAAAGSFTPAFFVTITLAILSGIVTPTALYFMARNHARQDVRLRTIERQLSRNSKATVRLLMYQKIASQAQEKMIENVEELDEAIDQLQLATAHLQARTKEYDKYIITRLERKSHTE